MKIFKYKLELKPEQTLELPYNHRVLSTQVQGEAICIWVMTSSIDLLEDCGTLTRSFVIVGTGQDLPIGELKFLNTVQLDGFVWHIFQKID